MQRVISMLKQDPISPGNVLTCQLYLTGVQVKTFGLVVQPFEMDFRFLINIINGTIRCSKTFTVVILDCL